jgi:EAL domain-containing protein (putative c-di-GMP-specific phosphodiesterase class I)
LSQPLHTAVIAEGVETAAQLEQIRSMGCRYAQGYALAHPMEVEGWIRHLTPAT